MNTEREPGAATPSPVSTPATIAVDGVSFTYPSSSQPVLENLSFEIQKGQLVGIVGPSGAGKTTLAGLLLGLFPPSEGLMKLDNRPYAEYDLSELRSRMAWVAQDPMLYDLSLAENIRQVSIFTLWDLLDEFPAQNRNAVINVVHISCGIVFVVADYLPVPEKHVALVILVIVFYMLFVWVHTPTSST